MRISDWSSDVCSSDLPGATGGRRLYAHAGQRRQISFRHRQRVSAHHLGSGPGLDAPAARTPPEHRLGSGSGQSFGADLAPAKLPTHQAEPADHHQPRSEAPTSELQSPLRTSYTVFCLKPHNNTTNIAKQT